MVNIDENFNLFSKKQPKGKSGFFKPQVKVQMFRYPSIEAPEINQGELSRLVRNIEPDRANKILRHQARSISTAVSLASGFFDMIDSEVLGEQGFILDIATKSKDLNTKIQTHFGDGRRIAAFTAFMILRITKS